jgi:hypothetical protein
VVSRTWHIVIFRKKELNTPLTLVWLFSTVKNGSLSWFWSNFKASHSVMNVHEVGKIDLHVFDVEL